MHCNREWSEQGGEEIKNRHYKCEVRHIGFNLGRNKLYVEYVNVLFLIQVDYESMLIIKNCTE